MAEKHNFQERVNRGVAWLDENVPLWEAKIVMEDFDLARPCRCVLGFVYKDEAKEMEEELKAQLEPESATWARTTVDGYWFVHEKATVLGLPVEDGDYVTDTLADFGFDLYEWEYDKAGNVPFQVMQEHWEKVIKERLHA